MREAPAAAVHRDAVELVYRREGPRLWRAILAFTGDLEVTNDVVAEAFAQCLHRGAAVRSPSKWVWRAAFRIAAGQLKERGERTESASAAIEELDDPPQEAVDVLSALGRLSSRQRAVVVLRYFLGYRPSEIAEVIGAAPPTVRVHLMRGLRRLRAALEEEGHEA